MGATLPLPKENPDPALVDASGADSGAGFGAPNGFTGAALLIGGKAVLEEGLAAGAGAAANGLFGAIELIGGKALLAAGFDAGTGAGAAANGLFGATALIGGNPPEAGFVVFVAAGAEA